MFAIIVAMASCNQRVVSRIDPSAQTDLSGRWNDSDSKMVAEKMVNDFLSNEKYKEYAKVLGHKPAIIVGLIRNKTAEHIDADNYIKKFELAIFNSGVADMLESGDFRDKLRLERVQQQDFASAETTSKWGLETGADLMLFGEMTSETDVYGNKRTVNYITTLYLTDLETNKRIWYGQQEIKKFIKN
jgi:penicillin-binding protein activator